MDDGRGLILKFAWGGIVLGVLAALLGETVLGLALASIALLAVIMVAGYRFDHTGRNTAPTCETAGLSHYNPLAWPGLVLTDREDIGIIKAALDAVTLEVEEAAAAIALVKANPRGGVCALALEEISGALEELSGNLEVAHGILEDVLSDKFFEGVAHEDEVDHGCC